MSADSSRWLVLIHQIPPDPAYLRVKVGRRLVRVGALALKNSVYALPRSDAALEDFQWVRGEVIDGGGDATILDGGLVEGLTDAELIELFREQSDREYGPVEREARAFLKKPAARSSAARRKASGDIARLTKRFEEIVAHDFFGAPRREVVDGLLRELRERAVVGAAVSPRNSSPDRAEYVGRTWVTRAGIRVDRIASAWLIRRFVDAGARFKFVPGKGYRPELGEIRFDMFEAEFSHEGEACTFEVICARFGLSAPGLKAVAEIVHDIDLKDEAYARPEVAGIAAMIAGICASHESDEGRLEHGAHMFEHLLAYYAALTPGHG